MPNADWNIPTTSTKYIDFIDKVKVRDEDAATQFTGSTGASNIPDDSIQWDDAAGRWKKRGSGAWGELTDNYKLTSLEVTGAFTPANGLYLPSANTPTIRGATANRLQFDDGGAFGFGGANYGAAGAFLQSQGTGSPPQWVTIPFGGGEFEGIALIIDQKDSGTNGGTFSNGAWRARDLNIIKFEADDMNIGGANGSYPDSFLIFGAGLNTTDYFIRWACPAFDVGNHQTRAVLLADTGSSGEGEVVLGYGSNAYSHASYPNTTYSVGWARLDYNGSATRQVQIQHRCQTSRTVTGFGVDNSFASEAGGTTKEIYTTVEIWKRDLALT